MTKITLTRLPEHVAQKAARDPQADLMKRAVAAASALSNDYTVVDDLIDRINALEAGIVAALRETDDNMRPILRKALHGEGGE